MREKFHSLLFKHHAKIREEVASISLKVAAFPQFHPDETEDFIRQVHTLKGSSGTMGFDQVFSASRALEEELRRIEPGRSDSAVGKVNALAATLCAAADAMKVTDSSLYDKFG